MGFITYSVRSLAEYRFRGGPFQSDAGTQALTIVAIANRTVHRPAVSMQRTSTVVCSVEDTRTPANPPRLAVHAMSTAVQRLL